MLAFLAAHAGSVLGAPVWRNVHILYYVGREGDAIAEIRPVPNAQSAIISSRAVEIEVGRSGYGV
jgi:hypothetical protein